MVRPFKKDCRKGKILKRISIIIPVYNGEDYIKRCLESILSQNWEKYEIILVDDGSTDKTLKIVNSLAEGQKDFWIIHQENQGVSVARNTGIEKAQGEWICFLDADDELKPGALEYLLTLCETDVQWGLCSLIKHVEGTKDNILQSMFCNEKTKFEGKQGFPELLNSQLFMYPVGKLYRKQIIQKYRIMFPEKVPYGEDIRFNLKYFQYVDKYIVSPIPVYIYHVRQGEGAGSKYYKNSFQMQMDIQQEILNMAKGSYSLSKETLKRLNIYFLRQGINTAAAYLTIWKNLTFKQRWIEIHRIMKDSRFQSFVEEERKNGSLHVLDYILLKNKSFLLYYGIHYIYTRCKCLYQRRDKS